MATPDEIQEKAFCKCSVLISQAIQHSNRLNAKQEANGLPPMNSLVTDFTCIQLASDTTDPVFHFIRL
ncbi:hypothetical protein PIIN_06944 [Serendipita indica DSM 11827]|uniref:Uncharacterized protein n=1 Tax=Serendipita indica (strain DSM 11827) TaxID=1109443 RepID=G4TNU1_SERID|nr:hypothetical protein PIIN_06944 [Serendipita indica DSM 11827]